MKTISLRFSEKFAPECGTIAAHQEVIDEYGFVWYGKLGSTISDSKISEIMQNENPKILLIHSGKYERYWANVVEISKIPPALEEIPQYYRDKAQQFKAWFKVVSFEPAPKNVMSQCYVVSSGTPLNAVSKYSMSPYFFIEYNENKEDEI